MHRVVQAQEKQNSNSEFHFLETIFKSKFATGWRASGEVSKQSVDKEDFQQSGSCA